MNYEQRWAIILFHTIKNNSLFFKSPRQEAGTERLVEVRFIYGWPSVTSTAKLGWRSKGALPSRQHWRFWFEYPPNGTQRKCAFKPKQTWPSLLYNTAKAGSLGRCLAQQVNTALIYNPHLLTPTFSTIRKKMLKFIYLMARVHIISFYPQYYMSKVYTVTQKTKL